MNLAQFIQYVKETSLRSPFINQAIDGDVYQINSIENQYGIFCITPMSVTTTDNVMTINSTMFYVDRLVEGETNMNQIQSDGITCLKTIIEEITNDEDVDISLDGDVIYTIFRYKFTDECAGVFAEVSLNVSNDDCEESYLTPKSGGESVIEIIKQNGITLPIVDKTVNIDAYTRANVDSLLLGINTSIGDLTNKVTNNTDDIQTNTDNIETLTSTVNGLSDDVDTLNGKMDEVEIALPTLVNEFSDAINGLDNRITPLEQNQPTVERFTVRYNPKFDTLHRPAGDRSPLLLNRSSIETINGKRFFNIDLIYNNYIPGSSPSTGFEQGEILFLFPRMVAVNYSDYTSLLDSQYAPMHTPTELYSTGQYYVAGWINKISEINTSTGATAAICCQISNVGEVVNNTTGFFKSSTNTLDKVYHITGRYEIASDWTIEEYNNYNFL